MQCKSISTVCGETQGAMLGERQRPMRGLYQSRANHCSMTTNCCRVVLDSCLVPLSLSITSSPLGTCSPT